MSRNKILTAGYAVGLIAVAQPAAALTNISIEGQIGFVDPGADSNLLGIQVGDPFSIEALYDDLLLSNVGFETLTPDTDPSLAFRIDIDNGALAQTEIDDSIYPFGPLINFDGGNFDSFVFQSNDFAFASDAFVQVIDRVEILDNETLDTLVTGEFRQIEVSPD